MVQISVGQIGVEVEQEFQVVKETIQWVQKMLRIMDAKMADHPGDEAMALVTHTRTLNKRPSQHIIFQSILHDQQVPHIHE